MWGCRARGTSLWGRENCFSPEDASEADAETGEQTLPRGELPPRHQNSEGPPRLGAELEQDVGWKERPRGAQGEAGARGLGPSRPRQSLNRVLLGVILAPALWPRLPTQHTHRYPMDSCAEAGHSQKQLCLGLWGKTHVFWEDASVSTAWGEAASWKTRRPQWGSESPRQREVSSWKEPSPQSLNWERGRGLRSQSRGSCRCRP